MIHKFAVSKISMRNKVITIPKYWKLTIPTLLQYHFLRGYVWFAESLRKSVKGKNKKNKKIKNLNLINYFYILLQIHLIYLTLIYKN